MKNKYWIYTPEQFDRALNDYVQRLQNEGQSGRSIPADDLIRDFMESPEARSHGLLIERDLKVDGEDESNEST